MRSYRVSSPAEHGDAAVARRTAAAAAACAGQHGVRAIRCDAVAGSPGECVAHAVASPRAAQRAAVALQGAHVSPAFNGTNRHHKGAAAYLVKAVSRHAGAELAEAGVLPLLTECLLDAMLAVRETAACALGHVAKHSGDMAMRVVETVAQDEAVARIALSVLSDVARHSLLHATAVADAGGITATASLLGSPDIKTRRQQVLDQHGASHLLLYLHDSSPSLRASAAAAVREVARQGPAAAGQLVGMGGIGPLLDALAAWRDEGEGEGMTKGSAKVAGQ
ncbi:unnamed protein product [Closterium sp. Naga37s-1]|nr:unnamed protein product [Closterium sp. Naga37s-1]